MQGMVTIGIEDLKQLVRQEIVAAYSAREELLWKKGQAALKKLYDETYHNEAVLLEQMGCLESGLTALTQQQKDLRVTLNDMSARVSSVIGDRENSIASGISSRKDEPNPWAQFPPGPYSGGQANPQTAPMIPMTVTTTAPSRGTLSDRSKRSTVSVEAAPPSHAGSVPPPPGLEAESPRAVSERRRNSTTISLSDLTTTQQNWEQWHVNKTDELEQTQKRVCVKEFDEPQRVPWFTPWEGPASQKRVEGWVQKPEEAWESWNITLFKSAEVPCLGADISNAPDGTIVLEAILRDGLLAQFNQSQMYPDQQVAVQDRLASVNGKTGQDEMRAECRQKMKLEVTILHRRPKGALRADAKSFQPHK